jgi:sulfonate transport system permease protein
LTAAEPAALAAASPTDRLDLETAYVSFDVAEPATLAEVPDKAQLDSVSERTGGTSAGLAATIAAVAALAGLLLYEFLPARRLAPPSWMDALLSWQHPYPVLLGLMLVLAVLSAVMHRRWHPLSARVRHYAPLLAGAICVLGLWDLFTAKLGWLKLPFYPSPDEVFGALIEDRKLLAISAAHSLRLMFCGYASGVVAGLATGVAIGWFARARYWGMPVLRVLGPIPATALVPLVMTIFSESFVGAAALIAMAVWFPMTMLTSTGIANVRRSHLDVALTLGARRFYLIFRVALPSALPNIFVGLFMGLGTASLTLPVAETLGVKAGLGWYLIWQKGYAEYANVYASLVIMAAFFSTLMTLLFVLRDRVLQWQKGVIRW